MKYVDLIEPCKSALSEGRCLGCSTLELPYFRGNKDCKLYVTLFPRKMDLDEEEIEATRNLHDKNKNIKNKDVKPIDNLQKNDK